MSERTVRVGELVLRELSGILHSRWRSESVGITLTHADVAPDLRKARIYYTAIGTREGQAEAGRFLMKIRKELKSLMVKNVTLKYTPALEFHYDYCVDRGTRIMEIFDEIDAEQNQGEE
jgi:ribosome-binding factor A